MSLSKPAAAQIANLLNTQNLLTTPYTAERVLQHEDRYILRSSETKIIGVVEVKRVQWYQCELDHLSVDPELKRTGVGSWLVNAAESRARDYPTYRTIVTGCRLAAERLGCLPIEVEQLWEGVDLA